jgi:hypothetical protein
MGTDALIANVLHLGCGCYVGSGELILEFGHGRLVGLDHLGVAGCRLDPAQSALAGTDAVGAEVDEKAEREANVDDDRSIGAKHDFSFAVAVSSGAQDELIVWR